MLTRDGSDRVHAVIAHSGVNQDGKTAGINNPNGAAQAALSTRVYREAGLDPGDTVFVEAHGTVSALYEATIPESNILTCIFSGNTSW